MGSTTCQDAARKIEPMKITSIIPRKDGKFLVGLHFNHGPSLRKIMTPEQVETLKAKIADDRARDAAYYQARNL